MEISVLTKNNISYFSNVSSNIFDLKYNESLVHQFVLSFKKNMHQRTKKQKSRGLVSGGGKKPWKQKGTGRARVGSIRSPLWKGGGKIFAAKGQVATKNKINKKVFKLGMKIIFSELIRSNRIMLIENISVTTHKTSDFLKQISFLKLNGPSLFILDNINLYLKLSSRNLKNIKIVLYNKINPIILLKYKSIYVTISAINLIEESYK